MYKIVFFVPETHKEAVKKAIFDAGAGRMGRYDCCSWETLGQGQFRPLEGADPYIGKVGEIERVPEYRIETVCEDAVILQTIKALKVAHPYEEPAYDVLKMVDIS